MESDKLNELNRQINEIKKRILLAGKFFKPQPMPVCYYNLFAGRAQRAAGTSSSSPEQAPAAG